MLINKSRSGRAASADVVFACAFSAVILVFSSFWGGLDNWLNDAWLNMRQNSASEAANGLFAKPPANKEIVLVLVDDKSILGIPGLYDGDRKIYAEVINRLAAAKPAVIGLSIFFASPAKNPYDDEVFIEAVKNAKNVVARAYRRDDKHVSPPFPALCKYAIYAPSYFRSWRDEAARTASLVFTDESEKQHLSFESEMYRILNNWSPRALEPADGCLIAQLEKPAVKIKLIENDHMLLNYDMPVRKFKTFSFYDVYKGKVKPELFENKAVIIGLANSMIQERFYIANQGYEYAPFLTAMTLRNLINHSWLTPQKPFQGTILALILLLVFVFFVFSFQPVVYITVSLLTILALLGASFGFVLGLNTQIDVMASIAAVSASLIFIISRRYYLELSEKLRIKSAFQHYVTASVVNEILKDPDKLNLHGEERNLTIFFSDIEGFTTISEGMSPLNVVSLLNEYLTEMTEIIFKYDGLLDKYEGDAIMAVFGAPIDMRDHAIRACRCALQNQKMLKSLRAKWKSENRPELRVRIGINTGVVVVGNMGSTMRFDYTVIGDNVNLASRLEMANKIFNTEIIVGEETAVLAKSAIISRRLAKMRVIGKTKLVNVYELLAEKDDPNESIVQSALEIKTAYETAQNEMNMRNFIRAESVLAEHLKKYPDDNPARILHNRVKGFLIVPPPPEWENIVVQDIK